MICLLYPDDYAREETPVRVERFEILDWFVTLCNKVVDERAEQTRRLLDLYPELRALNSGDPGSATDRGGN